MNAQDEWANYLDPETPSDVRDEIAAGLADHQTLALDRIGDILAEEAVWGSPSDDLRAGLLAQAASEAGPARPDDGDDTHQDPDRFSGRGGNGRVRRLGWFSSGMVAAAAAAAILFFALAGLDGDGDVTTFEVAGTELTPDVDATVDVEPLAAGVALTLHIKGLPPAGDGQYYAAWLMQDMDPGMDGDGGEGAGEMGDGETGDGEMEDSETEDGEMGDGEMGDEAMDDMSGVPMVGIGSFHWREGGIPIELWSGVDTDRYPIFMVTLQEEDGPPTASDVVVMTGRLVEP